MEGRCRKHPNHKQSRGVCPSCLRERLAQIAASSSTSSPNFSDTGSTPSSRLSPDRWRRRKVRKMDWANGVTGHGVNGKLKKSRSLTCVMGLDGGGKGKEKKGKRGFWSRLLGLERRNKGKNSKEAVVKDLKDGKLMLHSQTVKETTSFSSASARWAF